MTTNSGVEITKRALNFLNNISTPIATQEFLELELTGNQSADSVLKGVSLEMLKFLKKSEIINCDDPESPNAKIYGLTQAGLEMHNLFFNLVNSNGEKS